MTVTDNRAQSRYELSVDDATAVAEYRRDGDVLTFTHTIVPPDLGGRGIGSALIAGALADIRVQGLKIVAQCSFVAAYLDKHARDRDLLA